MKKIFVTALAMFMMLFALTSCGSDAVSRDLGIDVSGGKEISNYDTHGWLGDGTLCVAIQFDDDTVLEEIKKSGDWRSPLDDTARELLYGVTWERDGETFGRGPYLTDEDGEPLVPEIENGWYRLIDRRTGQAKEFDGLVFNLTLGVYDVDTNTLYFCKLDT